MHRCYQIYFIDVSLSGKHLSPPRVLLAFLAITLLLACSPAASGATARAPSPFVKFETSTLLVNVLYRYGRTTAAANGAYDVNVHAPRSHWYMEAQRAGATDVIAGVVRGDTGLIGDGLKMFHFALAREDGNGSFPGAHWPFHGAAMFLSEAAPALLVLKSSRFASRFGGEERWQTVRMHRAAYYMVRWIGGAGRLDDATKNHRFFEAAVALEATGSLTGDGTLKRWSQSYVRGGIRMERSSGVMPEDGGHDTGYQGLGLVSATRYLALSGHGSLYDHLYAAVSRAESWLLSRVGKDGSINQSGDTRTSGCQERTPSGHCKTVAYAPIFSALARWAVLADTIRYERTAYFVWLQNWKSQPGDVLPKAGLRATPSQLNPGGWLTVSGTRFQPLETVRVYVGGTLKQTIQADQIGSFGGHSPSPNAYFKVAGLGPGVYSVTASGNFGTTRHTTIRVTG